MTMLTPYLLFDGKCKQAMEFYRSCLGGELSVTLVKDTPAKNQMPDFQHEKVLNAQFQNGIWLSLRPIGSGPTARRFKAIQHVFFSAEGHLST